MFFKILQHMPGFNLKCIVGALMEIFGTHEDERTVLFKTISLDGIKPNTS